MPSIEFPKDGYKLLCISGLMDNGKAVWREVGTLTLNKKGLPTVSLDVTFNPAGVYRENPTSANVFLTVKPRLPYGEEQRDKNKSSSLKGLGFDYPLEDDIPF